MDALYRSHSSYVGTIALRILGDSDAADDVVQETFISAFRSIDTLRDPGAAKFWLARTAVRHAQRKLKRRRLRRFVGMETVREMAHKGATPEQRAMLSRVYEILDGLPDKERVAWTLRYLEGEKLDVVSHLCGCSLATAKRRITSAHTTIRALMDDG